MNPAVVVLKIAVAQLTERYALTKYTELIIEGLLLTSSIDGTLNLSPMGVRFSDDDEMVLLRPFKSSRSFRNLKQVSEAVFHITDDVSLIARAALNDISPFPSMTSLQNSQMSRLTDTCRWFLMQVSSTDDDGMRATMDMQVIARGRVRDFTGFNRAKHAVIESAIHATRVGILPDDEILQQLILLEPLVQKTGGAEERTAFQFVKDTVNAALEKKGSKSQCVAGPLNKQ